MQKPVGSRYWREKENGEADAGGVWEGEEEMEERRREGGEKTGEAVGDRDRGGRETSKGGGMRERDVEQGWDEAEETKRASCVPPPPKSPPKWRTRKLRSP